MTKSNLYVSISLPSNQTAHSPTSTKHTWLLSLEPHHTLPQLHSSSSTEPIHFSAILPSDGAPAYRIETTGENAGPFILGNVIMAESVKATAEEVGRLLKEKLVTSETGLPSEHTGGDDVEGADVWIRKALHILQQQSLIDPFDVGEFMTFAHAYAAKREQGETPDVLVAYPKLNPDFAKKAKVDGLWMHHRPEKKPAPRNEV
ncbi:hypothetical protein TI39_contig5819g00005 [Zymoseptoria brevis]|uniref:Uncharacterized protein n=1 Tax=Zymoseptoria brevis TaxID=1047168 RepID=A0A0F4G9C2_9PEZI|nr:hypothetical protein TI39_contig5819g00005 [Zymoseptoria brevis]